MVMRPWSTVQRRERNRRLSASGLLAALLTIEASLLAAPAVPGPMFQVNTDTNSIQWDAAAGMDAEGNFIVVWQGNGILARRYDTGGVPQGPEFAITAGQEGDPAVGMDAGGRFVVAWTAIDGMDPFGFPSLGITARRFNANGTPPASEFSVSTSSDDPAVAMNAAGSCVIAWTSDFQVFARRYDENGIQQGGQFQVSVSTAAKSSPAVAINGAGDFVVAWAGGAGEGNIFAQRFNANGTRAGSEIEITASAVFQGRYPAVGMDGKGDFVIAWEDGSNILAQRFDAGGGSLGSRFQLSSASLNGAVRPAVAMGAVGDFLITWEEADEHDENLIFAKRFDPTGMPEGSEFQVSISPPFGHADPAVAMDAAGNFVIAWASDDGSAEGVFARRYTVAPPLPSLSINDLSAAEADAGMTGGLFAVALSAASSQTVTVDFNWAQGTALAGDDFSASSGTLTFNPGETTKSIGVIISGDTRDEHDETFLVNLSNPGGATIARGQGVATIVDDDPEPALSIDDITVTEGDSGSTLATFIARLSAASGKEVTVDFRTLPGDATAGNDYTTTSDTLTFNPGETTKTIEVAVFGDTENEIHESFVVSLSGATNAMISDGVGMATIVNDDPLPPQLRIFKEFVVSGSIATAHTVQNGATVTYRLTVANGGDGPTTGAITVTDNLAAGLTFLLAESDPRCSASGQAVTCAWSGPLAPGDIEEFDLFVKVGSNVAPPGGSVQIHNVAGVSTPNDSSPFDNASAVVALTVEAPDVMPPAVMPPADVTVDPILAIGTYGAEPHPESRKVADFLAGARATDDVDLQPLAFAQDVVDCNDFSTVLQRSVSTSTLFPVGVSCVRFQSTDAAGNIGHAVARLTVNPPAGGVIPGPNVPVTATDAGNHPQGVELIFRDEVTPGALVVAQPIVPPPAAPTGFVFKGAVYEITTTATYTPPVEVCFVGSGFTSADLIWHDGAVVPPADHTVHTPTRVCISVTSLSPFGLVTSQLPGARFRRGEASGDGAIDLTDGISLLSYLFLGGAAPACEDAADANDDGRLDISDPLSIFGYLFLGRAEPPAPGPHACGTDPTADALDRCEDPGAKCP